MDFGLEIWLEKFICQHVRMVRTTTAVRAGRKENRNEEGWIQCLVGTEIRSQESLLVDKKQLVEVIRKQVFVPGI